jgi:hypothetical protein
MKMLICLIIAALPILRGNSQVNTPLPFLTKIAFVDAVRILQARQAVILDSGYTSLAAASTPADQALFCKRLKGHLLTADSLLINFDLKSVSSPYNNFSPNDSLNIFEYSVRSNNSTKINTIAFQTEHALTNAKGPSVGSAETAVRSASVQITRDAWNNATMLRCQYSSSNQIELRILIF